MAPTELLAEQHRNTFQRWFEPLGIKVVWLSGSLRKRAREQAYAAAADGSAQLLVGTHALFQSGLAYRSLALVIVDEQHRFGVHQRLQLMDKGAQRCSPAAPAGDDRHTDSAHAGHDPLRGSRYLGDPRAAARAGSR